MSLKFIAFVGIDSSTSIEELVELSNMYPNKIEWGYL